MDEIDMFFIETRDSMYENFKIIYEVVGKELTLSLLEDIEIFVKNDCDND